MADEPVKGRVNLADANVLLIDSNPQGREILSHVLSGIGVKRASKVETVGKAWEQLKRTDYDLIVCSSTLSDGDGYDFVSALRTSRLEPNRFTAVILLSGHTPVHDVRKARDCGANFVVAKPISPRILLERIIWIAREDRSFIEASNVYAGPDRRFQDLGPPFGLEGRRREDAAKQDQTDTPLQAAVNGPLPPLEASK